MTATRPRIALVDYGAGNLRSVGKALERAGLDVQVTGDAGAVRSADGVVLPGVGAFKDSLESLREAGLVDAVKEAIVARRPYLGLCLGLQLLFEEGDEHGVTQGLGVLRGRVEHFGEKDADGTRLRVPHIGWNEVRFSGDHPMLTGLPESDHFYFVHSYRAVPLDSSDVVGRTEYGGEFASAVAREGLFAVQFHPEKSQAAGKRLLESYRDWVAQS